MKQSINLRDNNTEDKITQSYSLLEDQQKNQSSLSLTNSLPLLDYISKLKEKSNSPFQSKSPEEFLLKLNKLNIKPTSNLPVVTLKLPELSPQHIKLINPNSHNKIMK